MKRDIDIKLETRRRTFEAGSEAQICLSQKRETSFEA